MSNYYNIGAKYEIVGRITNSTSVVAYMLSDKQTGQLIPMEKGIVEQLALNKNIYNCTAQIYNNLVNLKGINCQLSKLPKYRLDGAILDDEKSKNKIEADLKLVGKIQEGKSITHYVVAIINNPTKVYKVDKERIKELALNGRIINAKCQMNNGEALLRGAKGYTISQLKTYKV